MTTVNRQQTTDFVQTAYPRTVDRCPLSVDILKRKKYEKDNISNSIIRSS